MRQEVLQSPKRCRTGRIGVPPPVKEHSTGTRAEHSKRMQLCFDRAWNRDSLGT